LALEESKLYIPNDSILSSELSFSLNLREIGRRLMKGICQGWLHWSYGFLGVA